MNTRGWPRIGVICGVLLLVAVAGCGSSGSDGAEPRRPKGAKPLNGTRWLLTDSTELGVPIAGVSVTAEFADGRLTGESGCNTYRGSYRASGSKLTIGSDIATTQKACPPGPTAVEQAYLVRLPRVRSYAIAGTTLTLRAANDQALLVFTVADDAAAIVGSWTVTSFYTGNAVQGPATGSTLTAEFDGAQISGNSGCNTFSGPYTVSGQTIRIGPLASTEIACTDPALQAQEQQYLAALGLARTFRVTGSRLDLLREGGTFAVTYDAGRATG